MDTRFLSPHRWRRHASVPSSACSSSIGLAGQSRTVADRVYSDAQAARGQQLYKAQCVTCHGEALEGVVGPPLAGSGFLSAWSARSLAELVDKIEKTMPPEQPGSVTRQQAIDLAAYFLSAGKFPAGPTELASAAFGTDCISGGATVCGRRIRRAIVVCRCRQPGAGDARRDLPECEHPLQRAGEGSRQRQAGDADAVRLRPMGRDGVLRMAGGRSGCARARRDRASFPAARTTM